MRQAAPRARARSTTYVIIKEFLFDFNAAHVLYLRICVNALVGFAAPPCPNALVCCPNPPLGCDVSGDAPNPPTPPNPPAPGVAAAPNGLAGAAPNGLAADPPPNPPPPPPPGVPNAPLPPPPPPNAPLPPPPPC